MSKKGATLLFTILTFIILTLYIIIMSRYFDFDLLLNSPTIPPPLYFSHPILLVNEICDGLNLDKNSLYCNSIISHTTYYLGQELKKFNGLSYAEFEHYFQYLYTYDSVSITMPCKPIGEEKINITDNLYCPPPSPCEGYQSKRYSCVFRKGDFYIIATFRDDGTIEAVTPNHLQDIFHSPS